LKAESLKLLHDNPSPRAFFDLLVQHEQFGDAVRFLAHALPKRAAIWWGCLCLWDMCWPEPAEVVEAAVRAAVQWVLDPSEPHRRAAEKAGRAAGFQTAAGCLAMAAFWSRGSMSRP